MKMLNHKNAKNGWIFNTNYDYIYILWHYKIKNRVKHVMSNYITVEQLSPNKLFRDESFDRYGKRKQNALQTASDSNQLQKISHPYGHSTEEMQTNIKSILKISGKNRNTGVLELWNCEFKFELFSETISNLHSRKHLLNRCLETQTWKKNYMENKWTDIINNWITVLCTHQHRECQAAFLPFGEFFLPSACVSINAVIPSFVMCFWISVKSRSFVDLNLSDMNSLSEIFFNSKPELFLGAFETTK